MKKLLMTPTPAPLIPSLPCSDRAREKHLVADGFRDGDLLYLLAGIGDWPAGTVLPVLGFCVCHDVNYQPYALRAYVPGRATTYSGREAARFPAALQTEMWLGSIPMYFTEIDITDHADALALRRISEAVVIEMYPKPAQGSMRVAA
jgi:hypothetical protein